MELTWKGQERTWWCDGHVLQLDLISCTNAYICHNSHYTDKLSTVWVFYVIVYWCKLYFNRVDFSWVIMYSRIHSIIKVYVSYYSILMLPTYYLNQKLPNVKNSMSIWGSPFNVLLPQYSFTKMPINKYLSNLHISYK